MNNPISNDARTYELDHTYAFSGGGGSWTCTGQEVRDIQLRDPELLTYSYITDLGPTATGDMT
ncbi:MAG: hypothetical protein GY701_22885 [Sulfitobacter sp.]|nr:hypothetical protein [Sulfitobacter sp.]